MAWAMDAGYKEPRDYAGIMNEKRKLADIPHI